MKSILLAALGLAFSASLLSAAIQKADLAADLAYLRVHSYADAAVTIQGELSSPKAVVLDFRYATAGAFDSDALRRALGNRSEARPAYVLVSPETPSGLAAALSPLPSGIVTLGVPGSNPKPSVEVAQSADVDRRAYDAADAGMPIPELITGRLEKERFDEAALVREFRNEQPVPAPKAAAKEDGKEKAPVLTDRVLQRALHIHRALRAIKPRG